VIGDCLTEKFDLWAAKAKTMGFKEVAAGPLIRSSYKAEEMTKGRAFNRTLENAACQCASK
jgi:lipoate synthase